MGQLMYGNAEFRIDVSHRDLGVASRHDVRIHTNANRYAWMFLSKLFQNGNVVDVELYPITHGLFDLFEGNPVGRENDVLIVSVDGGCAGVEGVVSGQIGATSQQYPLKMASLGVDAIVEYAKTGNAPSGYTDTGVTLITNNPQDGVDSEGVVFGVESCWGEPSDGALQAAQEAEAAAGSGDSGAAASDEEIIIGLITKTETNPFFVKMKEGAEEAAAAHGATLLLSLIHI